ncbi:MAG TPA: glycosyltransferase family 39 protein [Gemmataceae bacterium]|nr:glycosyltransferase family 39 protein [Gemmataceae bacterium]
MEEAEPRSITRRDWLLLAALFALVLPLRLWLLSNTEVTARDSIGYIRYALQFEQVDAANQRVSYQTVLKNNHQHPGYPLLVLAMSQPVRAWNGGLTAENMELSTQLVNLIASLLLILPMYFLARQFFDCTVSFGGTLLYQYLPISAQNLSDGISEPVYLVMLVSGLLQLVHAVRERSVWRAMLCGLFTGLAYLTRPEGALILPTFGVVLIALQLRASWRCPWRQCLECVAAGAVTAALVGAPYYISTGNFSNKPTVNVIKQMADAPRATASPILFAATVARPGQEHGSAGMLARSAWALGVEMNQGFHYVAGVFAVLGFVWSFSRLRRDPGFWALLLYALLHTIILLRLGMLANYISDRHVMILVLGGTYFAVAGMRELPLRLLALAPSRANFAPFAFGVVFIALIAFCLPKALQRLHGNRLPNHEAGLWLADQFQDGDHIDDDHAWSHFFAGGIFRESQRPPVLPMEYVPTTWTVLTRSRDTEIAKHQTEASVPGRAVKWWPESSDLQNARVVVYSQPRDWDKNRWNKK